MHITRLCILFCLLSLLACRDNIVVQENGPDFYNCDALEALIIRLNAESDAGKFITHTSTFSFAFGIFYDDGTHVSVDLGCIPENEIDIAEWSIQFKNNNGTKTNPLKYVGELSMRSNLDSLYCPLMCVLDVKVGQPVKIKTRVKGKNGHLTDVEHMFPEVNTVHSLDVYGLYPNFTNTIYVEVYSDLGAHLLTDSIEQTTEELTFLLPEIVVTTMQIEQMQTGFTLVSERIYSKPSRPFIIDAHGECRWYLELDEHPQLFDLNYDTGIEFLKNGNMYFGDIFSDAVYEIKMNGELINSWDLTPYEFHHDVYEKPNGNLLVSINNLGDSHDNGGNVVEDHVVEIDRASGAFVKTWDLKEYLDEYRTVWGDNLEDSPIDWAHINSVVFDPSDNSMIVSCRFQGVVKIGADETIKWILAPHKEWGTNRRGEDLNVFLLDPLDSNADRITDSEVLDGNIVHPDFEWAWYQHAVDVLPNGDILLFDNGFNRNYADDPKYSRAVQYRIDESEKTIEQIWQYGKERGPRAFSRIVSDVDYLENGNILFAPGFKVYNQNAMGGKIIEVDKNTSEVVFEAELNTDAFITFHRVERMQFYN